MSTPTSGGPTCIGHWFSEADIGVGSDDQVAYPHLSCPAHAETLGVVSQVVRSSFGPEGDPEVWAAAIDEVNRTRGLSWSAAEYRVTDRQLLDAALEAGHLDSDGILALIRAAVTAGRAQSSISQEVRP